MALTVETGTGSASADSYVSEADADTINAAFGRTSWAAAASPDKEVALRKATKYLDDFFGERWLGLRANETQALEWPRAGLTDRDGFALDDDEMPQRLKDATAYMAWVALTDDIFPDLDDPGSVKSTRDKVGPIETAVEYSGSNSPYTRYSKVEGMLRRYFEHGSKVVRS